MKDLKPETILSHAGREEATRGGTVNPPVYRFSTALFPTIEEMEKAAATPSFQARGYGRYTNPTTRALEDTVAELEGGHRAVLTASGLSAITIALTAYTKAGDHVLMTDSVYGPARRFCDTILKRYGVEVEYYDPLIGAGIEALFRPNTTVLYMESPGSLTFEVQDVPAMTAAAKAKGIATMIDNTWATPLFFQPLKHGVDVSIHAATKYIVGHSDAMLGICICTEQSFDRIKRTSVVLGDRAGPDEAYLGLRGVRSLAVRLRQHQENALKVANWFAGRPEVARVIYPALPHDTGHTLWKRDFSGASGLFGIVLKPCPAGGVNKMLNGLKLFGMGASWGGFESLILPSHPEKARSATEWKAEGPQIRLSIGLENTDDLIADLEAGLGRLAAA